MAGESENERDWIVVVNQQEQYSVWFADRPLPNGWRADGKQGKKSDCLEHIAKAWTDMRPASLRDPGNNPAKG